MFKDPEEFVIVMVLSFQNILDFLDNPFKSSLSRSMVKKAQSLDCHSLLPSDGRDSSDCNLSLSSDGENRSVFDFVGKRLRSTRLKEEDVAVI